MNVENELKELSEKLDKLTNRLEQLFNFLLIEMGDEEEKREYENKIQR